MDRTKGKVCIVTGAALGIGRACALRLAAEGASIALFDVLDDAAAKLAEELKAMPGSGKPARYWHADVQRGQRASGGMSKTDAMIYAADKIRVNSVHPGFIWTPKVEHHLRDSGATDIEPSNASSRACAQSARTY